MTADIILAHMRGGRVSSRPEICKAIRRTTHQVNTAVNHLVDAGLMARLAPGPKLTGQGGSPCPRFVLTPKGEETGHYERPEPVAPVAPFADLERLDFRMPPSIFQLGGHLQPASIPGEI